MKKCDIPHDPYHQLGRYPILNTESAGINDPEGPAKYSNTEVKYRANFYGCHTALDTCRFGVLISGKK
jgi:hypothetical protein